MPGQWGSPEMHRGYAEFIEKLRAGQSPEERAQFKTLPAQVLTIAELIEKFWDHATVYYRGPNGPTGEHLVIQAALNPLLELFPDKLAVEFRPTDLCEVRDDMIRRGWSRNYVNRSVGRIKRLFNWATEKELVPAGVSGAIAQVKGLQKYRSNAKETQEVEAVRDDIFFATVAELKPEVADMLRVARLCACRPSELVYMNVAEIDRKDPECWFYRPKRHKNAHRGHGRSIPINREAQSILTPYLSNAAGGKLFHFKHRDGLRQSIQRACDRAFPHPTISAIKPKERTPAQVAELKEWRKAHRWTTNQIRHSVMQEVKDIDSHDGAQAMGGHRHSSTTDVYAKATERRAKQVAQRITLRPSPKGEPANDHPCA
jgi:integrase